MDEITITEEELQEKIKNAVEEKTAGLKKNRDELLEEKKEWQAKAQEREEKYTNLEKKVEELNQEKAAKEGNLDEVRKQIAQQKEKEIQEIQSEKEKIKRSFESRLVDGELTEALMSEEVAKPYIEPLKASLKGNLKVKEDENGEYKVVADNNGLEKEVAAFVSERVEELGKEYFVTAAKNSGGGAGTGGAGSGSTDNILDRASDNFNLTKAMQFVNDNGADSAEVQQLISAAKDPVNV